MEVHEAGGAAYLFGASLVPVWRPGHQRVKQDRLQKAAQGEGVSPGNSHDVFTAPTEGSLHTGRTQRCLHSSSQMLSVVVSTVTTAWLLTNALCSCEANNNLSRGDASNRCGHVWDAGPLMLQETGYEHKHEP